MKPIQLILVPLVVILVALYWKKFRSLLMDRLIVFAIGMAGACLIIMPELSSDLADLVGVGRGVDLVMYLALLGLGFVSLLIYSRLRQLEQRLTELARQEAIHHVKP